MSDPVAAVPAPRAVPRTDLTDGEWHHLHPATPLLRGGIFMVAIIGFLVANLRERLIDLFIGEENYAGNPIDEIYQRGALGWALLIIAGVLIVILVVFYLSWRMHTFRVSGEIVEVRTGLIFRSNRKARLDRVQGVNLARPLFPRLFGAARLEITVAGQDGNVQLAYLGSKLADDLRRDLLHLASGLRQARQPTTPPDALAAPFVTSPSAVTPAPHVNPALIAPGDDAAATPHSAFGDFAAARYSEFVAPELDPDAAPPESVVRIPPGRLIGSVVLSGFTVFLILAVFGLITSVIAGSSGWVLVAVLPGLIGSVGYYFSRITKQLRFTIAGTPDGVRIGFGLLSTSNQTLPPGRIHAIKVSQPILWRRSGWWQININTAGQASGRSSTPATSSIILPVGTLADVEKVLQMVLPGFDTDTHRALIENGMLGGRKRDAGIADFYSNAPARAVWLRPFSWWRTGWAVSGNVALIRRGVLSRDLILVPLARMQGVGISQGPVRRRLRLASADLHTVSGPVSASLSVLDVDEALVLFTWMSTGAVRSARADTSHHWSQTEAPTTPTATPGAAE
ncbi:PH domain-containing protein [Cryobacterium sp. PH29-G1]|uniref:PH domain-containing protein n=1 Tax=Cryobacterium sp. PH29-G1 TaxID=3046211 RepID=UPI0024BA3CF6|nr:PH domain-containing protein [Cryobacterium sp. PH29-G1]MDJ0349956.1 PH domain-containing protein [Cryobacterium sp. PH29-G1]